RLEVIDDMKLGLLVRRAGLRQRFYMAVADVEAEWADGLFAAVRAVEKNWFAALGYSPLKSVACILFFLAVWFPALVGPWLSPTAGPIALASLWLPAIPALIQLRWARWPRWIALLVPLGFPLFAWAGIHST